MAMTDRPNSQHEKPDIALVLLHGAGGTAQSLAGLAKNLTAYQPWAVDLPGRGAHSGTTGATAKDYADWLMAQCERKGLDRVCLVGHSLGGAVAIECALQRPTFLAGLVLLATGARLRVHPALMTAIRSASEAGLPPPSPPGLWRASTDPSIIDASEEAAKQVPGTTVYTDWLAADTFDQMANIRAIQTPSLVISGENDSLTPTKYGKYLAQQLPHSTYVELSDAGHLFPIEKPAVTAHTIQAFLRSL